MSPLAIDLVLDPSGATVVRRPRDRGRRRAASTTERFRGVDAPSSLAAALGRSSLLRSIRRIDLRILLETADAVLRVRAGEGEVTRRDPGDGASIGALLAPAVPIPLRAGSDEATLEVALERALLTGLVAALAERRFVGPVRLELAALVRCRAVVGALGPTAESRPGIVVDVTRAAVTAIVLDGSVRHVAAVPADDLRSALSSVVAAPLRSLVERERACGRSGWMVVSTAPALRAGVLAACGDLLPAGARIDVARPRLHRRERAA